MLSEEKFREKNPHSGFIFPLEDWVFEHENQRLVAPDKLYYTSTEDGRIQTIEYHPEEEFEWNRFQRRYKLAKDRATFDTIRYWHYEDVLTALTRDEITQELWDEYHAKKVEEARLNVSYDTAVEWLHTGRIPQDAYDAFEWLFRHSAVRFSSQHARGGKPDALAIPFAFDYPMCEIERFIRES